MFLAYLLVMYYYDAKTALRDLNLKCLMSSNKYAEYGLMRISSFDLVLDFLLASWH
jgi:hypothetical protein